MLALCISVTFDSGTKWVRPSVQYSSDLKAGSFLFGDCIFFFFFGVKRKIYILEGLLRFLVISLLFRCSFYSGKGMIRVKGKECCRNNLLGQFVFCYVSHLKKLNFGHKTSC